MKFKLRMVLVCTLWILFIVASLGQFATFLVGSYKFYVLDFLLGLYILFGMIGIFITKEKSVKIPSFYIFFLLFLCIALVSLIFSLNRFSLVQGLVGFFYYLRVLMSFLVSIVTFIVISGDKSFGKAIIRMLLISSLILGLFGVLQLAWFPNLSALPAELGWDPHERRLVSTFFDPNFTGAYLMLGFILSMSLALYTKKPIKYLCICGFLFVCLFLTFSRSSWLFASVAVCVFGIVRSRKLLIVTVLIAFLAYYAVPRVQTRIMGITDPSDSASLRFVSWSRAWEISRDNLLLGVGYNNFRYAQEDYGFFNYKDETFGGHAGAGSDSSLLLVLATTGLPGLILFLIAFVYLVIFNIIELLKKQSLIKLTLITSILGLLLHSMFVNSLFYPQILLWMAVLTGLSFFEFDFD
ncbi:MAG: O-antigen ligase family protein [Patescibacteria group bacterium]